MLKFLVLWFRILMRTLSNRAAIIAQLQKDILLLEGFKPALDESGFHAGLEPIKEAFPNARFPTGAIHEFISMSDEQAAATSGFICGILGKLMQQRGLCVWISSSPTLFPPACKLFDILPHHLIFIHLKRERDILWAMEEALKCNRLIAVVAELQEINLVASRRLQLAVEQSQVTGFVFRHKPKNLNNTSCISRWSISPLASGMEEDGIPGIGFPRWKVELLKIRNGRPGSWQMEWSANSFKLITKPKYSVHERLLKRG